MEITIRQAQERVDAWIREYGVRYFSELTNMAILTEETGEVARIIARIPTTIIKDDLFVIPLLTLQLISIVSNLIVIIVCFVIIRNSCLQMFLRNSSI